MPGKLSIFISIIVIIACSTAVWCDEPETLNVGELVPEFTLKDPYDKEHNLKSMLEKEGVKTGILLMGDRKVREDSNKWARELHKHYGKNKSITIFMIADLRDLPFFVTKGMVKWGTKREKLPVTILLDWGGKVNEKYKTQKEKTDLFIFDNKRRLLYHQVDKYSDETVKKVNAKVQKILKSDKPATDVTESSDDAD